MPVLHFTLTGDDEPNTLNAHLEIFGNPNPEQSVAAYFERVLGLDGDDILGTELGSIFVSLYGGGGNDSIVGGSGADFLVGDDWDSDTLKATGTGNDTIFGAEGGDLIYGAGGNDDLNGDKGNDTLIGGLGKDSFTGGDDADLFVFTLPKETAKSASGADIITDFSRGQEDLIDLHLMDASEAKSRNQEFDFIGGQKFHKDAGELRFERSGGDTYIYGDTDGNGKADFAIHLDANIKLKPDDFLL